MKEIDIDAIDLRLLKRLQEDVSLSNQALAESVGISPATSLRRVKRLLESGLIERQIAILQPQRLAQALGHGLTVVCEISLDQQGAEAVPLLHQYRRHQTWQRGLRSPPHASR